MPPNPPPSMDPEFVARLATREDLRELRQGIDQGLLRVHERLDKMAEIRTEIESLKAQFSTRRCPEHSARMDRLAQQTETVAESLRDHIESHNKGFQSRVWAVVQFAASIVGPVATAVLTYLLLKGNP